MPTTTFKIGDTIVHRIIEMECGFTPALEFLPKLTPEEEAEFDRRLKDPGPSMPIGEWIAELKARAAELEKK